MFRSLLLTAAIAAPIGVLADETGAQLPKLASPNLFLDNAGEQVMLVHLSYGDDLSALIAQTDRDGVLDSIHAVGDDFNQDEMDFLFVIVDDWRQAQVLADNIGSGDLYRRYGVLAGMTDAHFNYMSIDVDSDTPLHVFTVAEDNVPAGTPEACYVRGVMTLIYGAGDINGFDLVACAKSAG